MSENLIIENKQWSVKDLIKNVKLNKIIKPKFQRKQRWNVIPIKYKKKSPPSYNEYIKFLYRTKNSVDVISFGTIIINNEQLFINVDGNNRINAIIKFIQKPLMVLNDVFSDQIKILNEHIDNDIINNISYDEICNFRRLKDITSIIKITNSLDRKKYDRLEDEFIDIQKKLLLDDGSKFTESVMLNINIFNNGSYEKYNEIFKSINTHSNELSENELLASMLYSNNIELKQDNEINYKILKEIIKFYNKRDENEVLFNNRNNFTKEINIFDYMVGLQNYLHNEKKVIPQYDSYGLGLIFKLYKTVYNKYVLNNESFEELNTENFTKTLVHMNNILSDIFNIIFSKNLNDKLFGSSSDMSKHFKKNNLYILCVSILSLLKNNKDDKYIIFNLIKPVIYHTLIKFIPNQDKDCEITTLLKDKDKFKYEAGGSYIDNLCKKIYKNDPEYLFTSMNKGLFEKLLKKIIIFEIKNISHEKLKKKNKRRSLRLIHRIGFSIIFKKNVSIDWLKSEYSIEHIIPFSTSYDGEIDLDRIGNLFPIPLDYNKKRNNKHINEYKNICPEYYDRFIKNICNEDIYNSIIEYNNRKPNIIDNDKYNSMCNKNEEAFIKILLDYLFDFSNFK